MASTNHPSVRQARTQFQPASLKQINDHTGEAFGDACRRWMSQDAASSGDTPRADSLFPVSPDTRLQE
jgi:hypothetical protein